MKNHRLVETFREVLKKDGVEFEETGGSNVDGEFVRFMAKEGLHGTFGILFEHSGDGRIAGLITNDQPMGLPAVTFYFPDRAEDDPKADAASIEGFRSRLGMTVDAYRGLREPDTSGLEAAIRKTFEDHPEDAPERIAATVSLQMGIQNANTLETGLLSPGGLRRHIVNTMDAHDGTAQRRISAASAQRSISVAPSPAKPAVVLADPPDTSGLAASIRAAFEASPERAPARLASIFARNADAYRMRAVQSEIEADVADEHSPTPGM